MSSRLLLPVFSLACSSLSWSEPCGAQIPAHRRDATESPARSSAPAHGDRAQSRHAQERRDAWMLSIEGVTHAPLDWGLSLGIEIPPGLRVSGGLGWVPGSYMRLLTGIAANASGNGYAAALLEHAEYDGRTWRAQIGFRPFRSLGLYADVGYARVAADGALNLADSGVAVLEALGGAYHATTRLDMWLIELGYQGHIADRLVLGLGLGAMGTWNATTKLAAVGGARSDRRVLSLIERDTDAALEKYGVVPTLTLRLGFDLI